MITSLLLGTSIGVLSIGSATQRVVEVIEGHPLRTLLFSLLVSISYFISIGFIVKNDVPGYIGFSLGAASITCYQAWSQKKKLEKLKDKS